MPPDPLQRAGNYWEGRGRSPQRPGLFPLPLTSRFSSRSDCWRGKADCTDRGRWSPWAQPAHKQSTAALQLQIRQVSPELQVKKKKKRGEKKKGKKENTIQALPWPNLALLRKGNFPEPPSTNLEAQSCSQECQCKSRAALPAAGGVMAAGCASSPAGELLLSPQRWCSQGANSRFKGNQHQDGLDCQFQEFILFAEPCSGSPSPVLLRAACNNTAAALGWMGPHGLLRTYQKRLPRVQIFSAQGAARCRALRSDTSSFSGFFFGSSPLLLLPGQQKKLGAKWKRSASTPAPVYVKNLQGKS